MVRKIIAALAFAVLISSTTLAFSFWDNLTQTTSEVLSIGEGVTLEVTAVAEVPEGSKLVPAGSVLKANDIEEIVLTYNVKLDLHALEDLDLEVTASDVLIGDSAVYASLANIDIQKASPTVNNTHVLVNVRVSISNPSTYEEYLAIVNQNITFTLTFEGKQNN